MDYPVRIRSYGYSKNKRSFVQSSALLERDWTMFILEEGAFRYSIGGAVTGKTVPGEVLLGPPDIVLEREALAPMNIHYIVFYPHQPAGQTLLERLTLDGVYKFAVSDRARLLSSLRLVKPSSDRYEEAALASANHFLNDILLLLMHEISEVSGANAAAPGPLMETARKWLEGHAFEDVRLKELAGILDISQVALTRQFRAAYGTAPKDYMTALRLEKAKALLTDTDYTMEHVASLCGYDNGYYFSRIFEKTVRLRPSAYRKMHRL